MIALWPALALAGVDGRVLGRGGGDPIPAHVTVDGGVEVVAGVDGRFHVDVDAGPHRLHVGADGFVGADVDVVAPAAHVRVYLLPEPPGYEVVVESFAPDADPSRRRLDAEQAERTPGTYEDAVRLVQSLPGVAVQREYTPSMGDLSVRGSAPGDNRYYLDGIELPYLYHFHQYASVFPTSQLDTLELYPSTFSARYGDATGAIVDATSRWEAPGTVHGSALVNFVVAGADVRAPIGKGWWFSVAGRRSYQDLGGSATDQYALWPRFWDADVSATKERGDGATSVFLWGAGDAWDRAVSDLTLLDPVEQDATPTFAYDRAFEVVGVRETWGRGQAVSGRAVVAGVRDALWGVLSDGGDEARVDQDVQARVDVDGRGGEHVAWHAGAEATAERLALVVSGADATGILVATEAPGLGRGVDVDAVAWRGRGGVYGQVDVLAGPIRVFPGLRMPVDTTRLVAPEPRLAARYKFAPQTEIDAAGGLYHQVPDAEALLPGTGDPFLSTASAIEAEVGVQQTVASRLELGVTAYRKWLDAPLWTPIDAPPEAADRGDAAGVELTTRYRLREHFFASGWLAVATSTLDLDGETIPASGDQRVDVGLVAAWTPSPAVELGLRYRYGSGLPWTPISGSVYDATEDAWLPIAGEPNSARFSPYQKVDVHVGYVVRLRRASLTTSVELWYVPPSAAELYPTWNYDYTEQSWVRGPTLLPLLSMHVRY